MDVPLSIAAVNTFEWWRHKKLCLSICFSEVSEDLGRTTISSTTCSYFSTLIKYLNITQSKKLVIPLKKKKNFCPSLSNNCQTPHISLAPFVRRPLVVQFVTRLHNGNEAAIDILFVGLTKIRRRNNSISFIETIIK